MGFKFSFNAYFALGGIAFLAVVTGCSRESESSRQAEEQIKVALAHCPQLKTIVWKGNPIWDALVRGFDTSGLGFKTVFDVQPLHSARAPSESGPLSDDVFFVRVSPTYIEGARVGQERTAEEVLCNLVFELNNLRSARNFEIIEHLSRCGEITRSAFIYDNAQEEYFALRRTSNFYTNVWLKFCEQNRIKANPSVWLLPVEPTFRQRLARFPKNSWYPWKLFGGRYDQENWGLAPRATLHFLSVAELNDLKKRAAAGDAGAEERMGVACLCGETGASATNGEQALAWFLKAADQGDVLAQMDLEWMYRVGMGVPMDQKKSFDWGLKAAEHGDPVAEFFLAGHYEEGEGVAKNLAEALRWCEKSADQGYGEAEDRFGDALYRGEGVAKDQKRAVGYFLKAAPGNAHASHVVAICYADGFCFKKDLVEAYKWCLVSLSMDTDTQEASGLAEKLRKQLTEAQIKQAEKESIDNRPLDTPAKQ